MSESSSPQRKDYIHSLLEAYLELPETPTRVRRWDRQLAERLYERAIPLPVVQAAFLLASARRLARPPEAPPLQPIRCLYYFLPVIEEVLEAPLSETYVAYLRHKLDSWASPNTSWSPREEQ